MLLKCTSLYKITTGACTWRVSLEKFVPTSSLTRGSKFSFPPTRPLRLRSRARLPQNRTHSRGPQLTPVVVLGLRPKRVGSGYLPL